MHIYWIHGIDFANYVGQHLSAVVNKKAILYINDRSFNY